MLARVSRNQSVTAVFSDVWRASNAQPNWFRIAILAVDGALWIGIVLAVHPILQAVLKLIPGT